MLKAVLSAAVLVFALGAHAEKPKMDAKHAEMMKKFEEASKPGEQHKMLADLEG
jgi:hypothetical protein